MARKFPFNDGKKGVKMVAGVKNLFYVAFSRSLVFIPRTNNGKIDCCYKRAATNLKQWRKNYVRLSGKFKFDKNE